MFRRQSKRPLARYERVYHRGVGEYGNVLGPGVDPDSVLVAFDRVAFPVSRRSTRPLRWYERLLNR